MVEFYNLYYLGVVFILIFGFVAGSFIGALTYRWPKDISILKGRSFCPKCKNKISWYDNIPLFSYLLLAGKCRRCEKRISPRYPLIEASTGIIFLVTYSFYRNCATFKGTTLQGGGGIVCTSGNLFGWWALPLFLLIGVILVTIFVFDLEHQIIPDNLTFLLLGLVSAAQLISLNDQFYKVLFIGFGASFALLVLNLVTKGRGMGLGDVKLVIPLGIILGWPNTLAWLYLSFIVGAIVGILLISMRKASFGKPIAFGPFLIFSFFVVLFWGDTLSKAIVPFLF